MEFTLYYQGNLKANHGADDKHQLRRHFHTQMREVWDQKPLDAHKDLLNPIGQPRDLSVLRTVGTFNFVPLASERIHLVAELDIILLRPEAPGSIITQGGDIDNRLKTLLDALKFQRSQMRSRRMRRGRQTKTHSSAC